MKQLNIRKNWSLFFCLDFRSWVLGIQYWPCKELKGGIIVLLFLPFAIGFGYVPNEAITKDPNSLPHRPA